MKNLGIVKSTVKPDSLVVDEFSVWEANDIQEVSENTGTENEFVGFSYELIQYTKDEYIKRLSEQSNEMKATLSTMLGDEI